MEYRKMGRTGLKVSELCLGTLTFRWTCDEATSLQILDRAWDAGINFLDTADMYSNWAEGNPGGVSEEIIGKWMKTKPRDQIIVATKCRHRMWDGPNGEGLSRHHIMVAVEHSLRRLQTDFIDLYQVHYPDWDTPLDETLRALDDLVHQGKVRYIGASNYRAWYLTKALWMSDKYNLARFDCVQPYFNLVHREEMEPSMAELCIDEGIGVIPSLPLAGGFLTGKYTRDAAAPANSRAMLTGKIDDEFRAMMTEKNYAIVDALREIGQNHGKTLSQTALAWLLTLPFMTAPIVGASSVEQLNESLGVVGYRLTETEMNRFDELTGVRHKYFG